MENNNQKNNYVFLLILWIVYLLIAFSVIYWLVNLYISTGLFFTFLAEKSYFLYLYLISIPLTTLVSIKGSFKDFKNKLRNTIILNFLVVFVFYAFYQILAACLSAYYLVPIDFCGVNKITDYELITCSTQAQTLFYIFALVKTIFVGSILSAIYLIFDRLTKKDL